MKKYGLILSVLVLCLGLLAAPVSEDRALQAAKAMIDRALDAAYQPVFSKVIRSSDSTLAFVYQLKPSGYMVISADDALAPVIAYSSSSSFSESDEDSGILEEMIRHDLSLRLQQSTPSSRKHAEAKWQALQSIRGEDFEQYPPDGYSPTGGWLKTNWTQSSPYNMYCPIDPVTQARSVAGCPAVAMAQIANYHQTINGTVFDDSDDYYHNYAGRSYWVDNDFETHGFASFPQLNTYLSEMMHHYKYEEELSSSDKGALVWACGIAAQQVYTSSGSGTFAVAQMNTAFTRFGFENFELLTDSAPDLYSRMASNMIDAMPLLLAVVTPAWDMGHNVVVDGWNTDDYFHLNFGWGGQYNGWYLLPDEIPYGLTVIEGAIVDITPKSYLFAFPDLVEILNFDDVISPHQIEVINLSTEALTIEAYHFPTTIGASQWHVETAPEELPYVLEPGQSMYFNLWVDLPVNGIREVVEEPLRIIHSHGTISILVRFDTSLITSIDDPSLPPANLQVKAYPNPFISEIRLDIDSKNGAATELKIYNLKGQCVRKLHPQKDIPLIWDGKDADGKSMAAGLYLLRVTNQKDSLTKRILKF